MTIASDSSEDLTIRGSCYRALDQTTALAVRAEIVQGVLQAGARLGFTKVRLPFGWLGNMSPHPIALEGVRWRTAEALFQALRFPEGEVRRAILMAASPMGAKMIAKKRAEEMVVVPRSDSDLLNMALVLRLKLEQHPSLRDQLLNTGDHVITEDVTARVSSSGLYWGAALRPDGFWEGLNVLGRFWIHLRQQLRASSAGIGCAGSLFPESNVDRER